MNFCYHVTWKILGGIKRGEERIISVFFSFLKEFALKKRSVFLQISPKWWPECIWLEIHCIDVEKSSYQTFFVWSGEICKSFSTSTCFCLIISNALICRTIHTNRLLHPNGLYHEGCGRGTVYSPTCFPLWKESSAKRTRSLGAWPPKLRILHTGLDCCFIQEINSEDGSS